MASKTPSDLWVTLENGSEATESRRLIKEALDRLQTKRGMVNLVHKGYQSSKTVIVRYDDETLEIDMPKNWPGTQNRIDILFRDETMIWNQVRVNILRSTTNRLFTEFPRRLVRIQRRTNYRVEVPRGSNAMFKHQERLYQNFTIVDISINGALLSTNAAAPFEIGDKVLDFHLLFPKGKGDPADGTILRIKQGKITRYTQDDNQNHLYGVFFELSRVEEKALLLYVHQRERELLRKGLSD